MHSLLKMKLVLVVLLSLVSVYAKYQNGAKEGEYIVRVDERLISSARRMADMIVYLEQTLQFSLVRQYHVGSLKFLHVSGDDAYAERLRKVPGVLYASKNSIGGVICAEEPAPGVWGLDRVDQRERLPYDDPLSPDAIYTVGTDEGLDVTAYVIDTGIDIEHSEFEGRAFRGYTDPEMEEEDLHGHGTHCAGTIGARSYGLAKSATLVAVKVINRFGFGSIAQFVGGTSWFTFISFTSLNLKSALSL